jgi:hypothetical protein
VTEIESIYIEKPKTHSLKDYFMCYLNIIESNGLKNRSIDRMKTDFAFRRINRIKSLVRNDCKQILDKNVLISENKFKPKV